MRKALCVVLGFALCLGIGSFITYLCKTKEENQKCVINIDDSAKGRQLTPFDYI